MIDRTLDKDGQLRQARSLFEKTQTRWRKPHADMRESKRFVHNTNYEGQWDAEDLQYLKDQHRPAQTMNVMAHKIQSLVGLHEDFKQKAVAMPTSGVDAPTSEALNQIILNMRDMEDMDTFDSQIYEDGVITGEANFGMTVEPDEETPHWVKVVGEVIPESEVLWDYESVMRNRSDARFVFRHRWISKQEFKKEFPDHIDKIEELFNTDTLRDESGNFGDATMRDGDDYEQPMEDNWFGGDSDGNWVSRKKEEIRIVRLECRELRKIRYAVDSRDPTNKFEITTEQEKLIESGSPQFGNAQVVHVWKNEVYWFEFIGNTVLYDGPSLEPFEGFSILPFICYMDTSSGVPYGPTRHMRDPQKDINKAFSQTIDNLTTQARPGWIAEASAVPDRNQFEKENATAGSVAIVTDGALTRGTIQPRTPPSSGEGSNTRLQVSLDLMDRISGIFQDAESPARGVEAAATVQLRERKAIRSMVQVLRNYQRWQVAVAKAQIQVIINVMPDDQIAALLANEQRYSVQGGIIVDNEKQAQIPIRDLRKTKYSVKLEAASSTDTQRLTQLNVLLQIASLPQGNVPIDPELVYELASGSKAIQDRLKMFGKAALQQQQQAQQTQQQLEQQQLEIQHQKDMRIIGVEEQKVAVDAQDNQAKQRLDRVKTLGELKNEVLAIWERADQAEKAHIEKMQTPSRST